MRGVAVVHDGRDHAVDVLLAVLEQHRSTAHDALLDRHDHVRVAPAQTPHMRLKAHFLSMFKKSLFGLGSGKSIVNVQSEQQVPRQCNYS